MEENKYDLIVIGAGSAGLTLAIGGAQIGAKVLLVEKDKIGGDCTHSGCVPSKTLINMSREIKILKKHNKDYEVDLEDVLNKVQDAVNTIYENESPEEIRKHGIDIKIGQPRFVSKNEIEINEEIFKAKKIAIATGSLPNIPEIKGLGDIKYMTSHRIFNPTKYKSLTIIGGGPLGCELGQAFNNLGIKVTIINSSIGLLDKEDKDASNLLITEFEKAGIKVFSNMEILNVKKENDKIITFYKSKGAEKVFNVESEQLLIATGRRPNIDELYLDKANVKTDSRGIFVNDKCKSSNNSIYAAGDVTRGWKFTHFANHQAKVALSNIIFGNFFKYEKDVIPRVTYTEPEIASIGITDNEELSNDFIVLRKDYEKIDRAITDNNTTGFFKIIVDKKGYIKGACLTGRSSGELIGEIALAMKNNIKITSLADTIHPYPTYSYGLRNCADQFRSLNYTENKKKWVKRIFGLNGN